jgi:hypothetical protein
VPANNPTTAISAPIVPGELFSTAGHGCCVSVAKLLRGWIIGEPDERPLPDPERQVGVALDVVALDVRRKLTWHGFIGINPAPVTMQTMRPTEL